MSWGVYFCACFDWIVVVFALLMPLFADFCYLLPGQLLQVVVRVAFNLNLLTRNDFHLMLVYHFCLYLKVWVVIGRLWKVVLTHITRGWIFYYDLTLLAGLVLTCVLFLLFVVKDLLCNWHFTKFWSIRCMFLGIFQILCFWCWPLFINQVIKLTHKIFFIMILLAIFTCVVFEFITRLV